MRTATIAFALLTTTALATPAMARGHHHHHRPFHHHHLSHRGAPSGSDHENQTSDSAKSETSGQFAHMASAFVDKLKEAFSALPEGDCSVESGYRTHSEQARLYRSKPGLAARPGHSNHERGLAADLSCHGGALAWLHRHAADFGLRFPMSYEAWHIEPEGATRLASARRHRVHYAAHHHRQHYARAG